MHFVSYDPPELLKYDSMKEVLVYHEAAHLLLAYYNQYEIGMFRFWDNKTDVFGAIRNRRIANPPEKDTLENVMIESRKVQAGEIAARIQMKLPLTDFVLPLTSPKSETVTQETPFVNLKYIAKDGGNHDAIKLLELYRKNQDTIQGTWWSWFWGRHAETISFVQEHWNILSALAERLLTVKADEFDQARNAMQGYRSGETLIEWCEEVGAPRMNPELKSTSY